MVKVHPQLDHFKICCNKKTVIIDSYRTCLTCGKATEELVYDEEFYKKETYSSLYKRFKYFENKVDLIRGKKTPDDPMCNEIIEQLKTSGFETIFELRTQLKKLKANKLYKYIYNIYHEIKNKRLIQITDQQKARMVKDFLYIEKQFKKKQEGRKNIYNYNLMIYILMKHYNIDGCEHVILPVNKHNINDQITHLLKETTRT
jgi:hypothetical protein